MQINKINVLASIILIMLRAKLIQGLTALDCNIPAMFIFGDALSDTGNCFLSRTTASTIFCNRTAYLPYGQTFPHYGFSRYSDGLLLVDWLCTFHTILIFIYNYLIKK